MMLPAFEERLVAVVVVPGKVHEDFTQSPAIALELCALLPEKGAPLYQVVATTLDGARKPWTSCLYELPLLASTEYFRLTDLWIPESAYKTAVAR